jgi:hypothetical protein
MKILAINSSPCSRAQSRTSLVLDHLFMEQAYSVEGDFDLLLKYPSLFST